jgi:large subunit ribosomal protein L3
MGGERTTVLNLTLHGVDNDKGLLLIKGAVPGPAGSLVLVRSAVKSPLGAGGRTREAATR